jgi:hypothetical protein
MCSSPHHQAEPCESPPQLSLAGIDAWETTCISLLETQHRLAALSKPLGEVSEALLSGPEGFLRLTGVDTGRLAADGAYQVGISADLTKRGAEIVAAAAALGGELLSAEIRIRHLGSLLGLAIPSGTDPIASDKPIAGWGA